MLLNSGNQIQKDILIAIFNPEDVIKACGSSVNDAEQISFDPKGKVGQLFGEIVELFLIFLYEKNKSDFCEFYNYLHKKNNWFYRKRVSQLDKTHITKLKQFIFDKIATDKSSDDNINKCELASRSLIMIINNYRCHLVEKFKDTYPHNEWHDEIKYLRTFIADECSQELKSQSLIHQIFPAFLKILQICVENTQNENELKRILQKIQDDMATNFNNQLSLQSGRFSDVMDYVAIHLLKQYKKIISDEAKEDKMNEEVLVNNLTKKVAKSTQNSGMAISVMPSNQVKINVLTTIFNPANITKELSKQDCRAELSAIGDSSQVIKLFRQVVKPLLMLLYKSSDDNKLALFRLYKYLGVSRWGDIDECVTVKQFEEKHIDLLEDLIYDKVQESFYGSYNALSQLSTDFILLVNNCCWNFIKQVKREFKKSQNQQEDNQGESKKLLQDLLLLQCLNESIDSPFHEILSKFLLMLVECSKDKKVTRLLQNISLDTNKSVQLFIFMGQFHLDDQYCVKNLMASVADDLYGSYQNIINDKPNNKSKKSKKSKKSSLINNVEQMEVNKQLFNADQEEEKRRVKKHQLICDKIIKDIEGLKAFFISYTMTKSSEFAESQSNTSDSNQQTKIKLIEKLTQQLKELSRQYQESGLKSQSKYSKRSVDRLGGLVINDDCQTNKKNFAIAKKALEQAVIDSFNEYLKFNLSSSDQKINVLINEIKNNLGALSSYIGFISQSSSNNNLGQAIKANNILASDSLEFERWVEQDLSDINNHNSDIVSNNNKITEHYNSSKRILTNDATLDKVKLIITKAETGRERLLTAEPISVNLGAEDFELELSIKDKFETIKRSRSNSFAKLQKQLETSKRELFQLNASIKSIAQKITTCTNRKEHSSSQLNKLNSLVALKKEIMTSVNQKLDNLLRPFINCNSKEIDEKKLDGFEKSQQVDVILYVLYGIFKIGQDLIRIYDNDKLQLPNTINKLIWENRYLVSLACRGKSSDSLMGNRYQQKKDLKIDTRYDSILFKFMEQLTNPQKPTVPVGNTDRQKSTIRVGDIDVSFDGYDTDFNLLSVNPSLQEQAQGCSGWRHCSYFRGSRSKAVRVAEAKDQIQKIHNLFSNKIVSSDVNNILSI